MVDEVVKVIRSAGGGRVFADNADYAKLDRRHGHCIHLDGIEQRPRRRPSFRLEPANFAPGGVVQLAVPAT